MTDIEVRNTGLEAIIIDTIVYLIEKEMRENKRISRRDAQIMVFRNLLSQVRERMGRGYRLH